MGLSPRVGTANPRPVGHVLVVFAMLCWLNALVLFIGIITVSMVCGKCGMLAAVTELISVVNKLWVADITYARIKKGFVYAAFVTDVLLPPDRWVGVIRFHAHRSFAQVTIAAAVLCFLVPAGKNAANQDRKYLLEWADSKDVPWGLLLFGGGLSLSAMFSATGLSEWVGQQVSGLQSLPHWVILLAVMIVSLALTELTSNTATAAAFLSIFGSVAVGLGIDPLLMTVTVTLAVCSAYMLPVATPSNAVAYGSGEISVAQMARAGVWLNFISIAVIMAVLHSLVPLVFGTSIS